MRKPVTLSTGRTFATQAECRAYFRALRARYAAGERLNREDHQDLEALLHRHPDRAELCRDWAGGFTVTVNDWGAPSFAVAGFFFVALLSPSPESSPMWQFPRSAPFMRVWRNPVGPDATALFYERGVITAWEYKFQQDKDDAAGAIAALVKWDAGEKSAPSRAAY